MTLSREQLDAIRERCEKASPGPWWQASHRTKCAPTQDARELSTLLCHFQDEDAPRFWRWDTDGEFVAAARSDIPALLAHVSALEAELTQLRDEHARGVVELGSIALMIGGWFRDDVWFLEHPKAPAPIPCESIAHMVEKYLKIIEYLATPGKAAV
jgi:hypothetical protein